MFTIRFLSLVLISFVLPMGGSTLAQAAGPDPLPRFATHVRTPIHCEDSPFGRTAVLGQDSEFIDMINTSSTLKAFQEYRPATAQETQPYTKVFESALFPGALAGSTFLKAVSIDLNGDGRDEVVTANRLANGNLILGVFRRNGTSAELFDTWTLAQAFTDVHLVAGNLDGSADHHLQLGVLVRTIPSGLRAVVLTGRPDGGIQQADDASAGAWMRASAVGVVSLAVGDMILDGHEQLVVVNETGSGSTHALNYHLLEYLPSTSALPIAGGDVAIGSKSFTSVLGTSFQAANGNPTLESMIKLVASAGDLVDTAAAELVIHLQVRYGGSQINYIGQRLHHFTTTRDANNAITGIGFFSRGAGQEYDSSQIVQGEVEDALASFEATIGNVDRISPSEIILARSDPNAALVVSVFKAQVDFNASYTYARNGRRVTFTNQSTGSIASRTWNFGDGSGPETALNPIHQYASDGNYTVTLTVTGSGGGTSQYSQVINVTASGSSTGGQQATYAYHVRYPATYQDSWPVSNYQDLANVNVAVGDMDRDGIAEIMTIARNTTGNIVRSRWRLANTAVPTSFTGSHVQETQSAFNSLTGLDLVAADFDGDSVHAVRGTDCRHVIEPQVRQVVWLPPYFRALQANAQKLASFGTNSSQGSSLEESAGSFTSHDVSAYVGVALGTTGGGVSASVKATAGYNQQVSRGALHGSENTFEVGESSSQTAGEALTVIEENDFNCYSYGVKQYTSGTIGDSSVRMCEVIDGSKSVSASDAVTWDTAIPAASPSHPPSQWLPLHRDWQNIALFRPVISNASPLGAPWSVATDGIFQNSAFSFTVNNPYLEIDLGSVQNISNIRVSPPLGLPGGLPVPFLQGFHIYASATPFAGDGIPSGAGVSSYAPETADDAAYSRWNVWTRDRNNPVNGLLQARYIRLQKAGSGALGIAEIQVFGDVHAEPPAYPDAVCDAVNNDGVFLASVWDSGSASFRTIEVLGDLIWNGSGGTVPGCTNYAGLPSADIWPAIAIGASGDNTWNMSQASTSLVGSTTGFESSTRVGAEFDLEAGFIASVQAGGAYEFTKGITEEVQTTSYWGTGLGISGSIGGFGSSDQSLINACKYRPRPYAYRLSDKSNTGYEHVIYAVDYVVRQATGLWTRDNVPTICTGVASDTIFRAGFE
jgi:PKD repeat protein